MTQQQIYAAKMGRSDIKLFIGHDRIAWESKRTMVRFMTRLGIKGNLAYLHSQVKKAIMVRPPTTNMAIKDPAKRN